MSIKIKDLRPLPIIDTAEAWTDSDKELWCERFGCADAECLAQQSGANLVINYYEGDEVPITATVKNMSPIVAGYDNTFAGFYFRLTSVPRSAILGINTNGINPLT